MFNIAIIGAGQLGGRHLQALLKYTKLLHICVIDPSDAALREAKTRAEDSKYGADHNVTFATTLTSLPGHIDYAIVATSSDVRMTVIEQLIAQSSVRNLLLEKVLFQRGAEYAHAIQMLDLAGVRTWVDCPRRVFPFYKRVQEFFNGETICSFNVTGGSWGLACNGVHFLDLFAYLSGEIVNKIDTALLDPKVIDSRRRGFVEVTGTLTGRSANAHFSVTSWSGVAAGIVVAVRSPTRSCVIDETGGVAFFGNHAINAWDRELFALPFLSDALTGVASGILETGSSALPSLSESSAVHLPFITSLGLFISERTGRSDGTCPIT
ncbi:Gfo/Idh/MocA family oxidoreductase (plasmid) [Sphingomonadaceae bacterium OTU29THOMA1]|nr:Gfo/Idh/MocA family oxidoreductase [Sphingomonadaceae bacterium OTU29THOMA1]